MKQNVYWLEINFVSMKRWHKNSFLLLKSILQGSCPGSTFNIETFEVMKQGGTLYEQKGNLTIT